MSIRSALKAAEKGEHPQHRVGAVIVKGHRIISTGHNQFRYTKELKNSTLHAEEAAILKILKSKRQEDLINADIYVSRFTAGGAVGFSKPCVRCSALCRSVGIRGAFYTLNGGGVEYIAF